MKTTLKGPGLLAILLLLGASGTVFGAASVTSNSPNAGPSTGGQTVRLRGSGFNTTLASNIVTIGGVVATNVAVNGAGTILDVTTNTAMTPGLGNIIVDSGVGGPQTFVNVYTVVQKNNTLVVNISATVAKRAQIQWGDNTSNDEAGTVHGLAGSAANRISAYAWTVRDNGVPVAGQIDIATSYRSDDFNNNKTIFVSNVSGTSSNVNISAQVGNVAGACTVANGTGAAQDIYGVNATLGAGPFVALQTAAPQQINAAVLQPLTANDQALVISVDTPTSLSNAALAAAPTTFSVTLTATAQ